MKKKISVLLWVLAFFLTIAVIFYQRMTGPTHPIKGSEYIDGNAVSYKLLRSYTSFELLPVEVKAANNGITGFVKYKRYKSNDAWTEIKMIREGEILTTGLPGQPSAGKIEYLISLNYGEDKVILNKGMTIVARFKDSVPSVFLITHIFFMIFSFLFAIRTGLEALRKKGNYVWMVNWTLGIVFVGGMILGPVVQKYAFGDFWTGIPFGTDLTDNKTLFAFVFWIVAFFLKRKSKWWVFAATIMMIIVYLIPHSTLGSELDYSTGKMKNKYSNVLIIPKQELKTGRFTFQHFG